MDGLNSLRKYFQLRHFVQVLLFFSPCTYASPTIKELEFLERENLNDHFLNHPIQTDVPARFQVGAREPIRIRFLEIPVNELHVEDSDLHYPDIREHMYSVRQGKKYIRFFIHPESEGLYAKLIKKYGVKGFYLAFPTSSPRTLLAWDPTRQKLRSVFIKLSLDKMQFGVGRAVPDSQIRRSVAISKLFADISETEKNEFGVDLISEVGGAYISRSLALPAYIDNKLNYILQHGLLFRDTSFISETSDKDSELYPLFALFAKNGVTPPLLVQWAKESGLSFDEFVEKALLQPFVRAASYLIFKHGIIPDSHGQNVIVKVSKKNHHVVKFFFRDIGGMMVDSKIRWLQGLSSDRLLSHNPIHDFKFNSASSQLLSTFDQWFFPFLFTGFRGQDKSLKPFIPDYDSKNILRIINKHIAEQIQIHLPGGKESYLKPSMFRPIDYVNSVFEKNAPKVSLVSDPEYGNDEIRILHEQMNSNQTLLFPRSLLRNSPEVLKELDSKQYVYSELGILFKPSSDGEIYLLLPFKYSSEKPTNYNLQVSYSSVFAGKSMGSWAKKFKSYEIETYETEPIDAIRFGTSQNPSYQLIGNHELALFLYTKPLKNTLLVNVSQDITDLPKTTQIKILTLLGRFWSPKNQSGAYKSIPILELKPTELGSLYDQTPKLVTRNILNNITGYYFPEIEFARWQYEKNCENKLTKKKSF